MIDVVEIKDKDGRMTLTVKREFMEKCEDPSRFSVMELNKDLNMMTYLHNENGPAIKQHKGPPVSKEMKELVEQGKYLLTFNDTGRLEYWLDGRCISAEDPEAAKRLQHHTDFNKSWDSLMSDSTSSSSKDVE
jgi:hypothetical protein